MEIQQLKGFHAVAKYKNFTTAAHKTQRTQPTISLQIKALEDELGVKLFERLGPRKVTMTPEGQILQDLTAPLLGEFNNIVSRFNEARGLYHTSSVRIATHSSVMIFMLPEIIKKFKAIFPQCQLCILSRGQKEIVSMLESGDADFGITSLDSVASSIDYKVVSRFNRVLITTKEHPLASRSTITLEDIATYPMVLPTTESNTRRVLDRVFDEHALKYEITMEVVGRTAIKTYVGMNLGISIINEYYLTDEDRRQLFVKNLSRHFGKAETGVVTKKGRSLSLPAKEFIRLIKEHAS